jgi:hypothetical protein
VINSINNSASAPRQSAELTPLVDRLAKQADVNRRGQAGSAEFSGVLTDLVRSLDADTKVASVDASSAPVHKAPAPALPTSPASIDDVVSTVGRRAAARYDEAARIKER